MKEKMSEFSSFWTNLTAGVMAEILEKFDSLCDCGSKPASQKHGTDRTLHFDISRTTQIPQAMDFFFYIPDGQRRWISAVNDEGYGFIQTSTDRLQGRKLFVWEWEQADATGRPSCLCPDMLI
ncbi:MAG: hypothetical protein ACOX22_00400 [Caldicoprobacterales bacterium]|jgi:hypothetical protein